MWWGESRRAADQKPALSRAAFQKTCLASLRPGLKAQKQTPFFAKRPPGKLQKRRAMSVPLSMGRGSAALPGKGHTGFAASPKSGEGLAGGGKRGCPRSHDI